jgi:hypothetical protein
MAFPRPIDRAKVVCEPLLAGPHIFGGPCIASSVLVFFVSNLNIGSSVYIAPYQYFRSFYMAFLRPIDRVKVVCEPLVAGPHMFGGPCIASSVLVFFVSNLNIGSSVYRAPHQYFGSFYMAFPRPTDRVKVVQSVSGTRFFGLLPSMEAVITPHIHLNAYVVTYHHRYGNNGPLYSPDPVPVSLFNNTFIWERIG